MHSETGLQDKTVYKVHNKIRKCHCTAAEIRTGKLVERQWVHARDECNIIRPSTKPKDVTISNYLVESPYTRLVATL